ncbi:Shedu anti-phage system protein SduA domain-containing protein [Gillisia sp. Hel_I_29]|uniref:Shedu anti-phage system protein SduA domain-containing protein n=1 Tax=Gillisia sp. Hel_I_29 TaxID=1249975 RepID=UPI0006902B8E|nr:Shedu anti-phage system protein SduA domain-containing protein [Gillisia sp. Hel_I_29]
MKVSIAQNFIENKLKEFNFQDSTVKTYMIWQNRFFEYHNSDDIKALSFNEITEYITFLKNENHYSKPSIRQAITALEFLYNRVFERNYPFKKIKIKRPEQTIHLTISKPELITILDSIKNLKHNLIISLIYACGLDVSELIELRKSDLLFDKNILKIRKYGKIYRESNFGDYLKTKIDSYLEIYKPKYYLFENDSSHEAYSKSSVRNIFNRAKLNILNGEQYSIKHLKFSYVKHLVNEGFQLTDVINHIGLKNYEVYSKIEGLNSRVEFSPIDSLYNPKNRKKLNIQITDEQAENIVFTDHQSKKLLENNPNIIKSFIENDIKNADITALGFRKKQLKEFEKLLNDKDYFDSQLDKLGNRSKENLWQVFFEKNTWIFGFGLNYVFISNLEGKKIEQVVSGYTFNSNGKRVDGLLKTRGIISTLCFIEIKTNSTSLLNNKPYRNDCWNPSNELSGAVSQIQKTVQKSINNLPTQNILKDSMGNPTNETVFLYQPKSFLIIGNLSEFKTEYGINESKFSSFELYRQNINSPEIITYDELYERAKFLIINEEHK